MTNHDEVILCSIQMETKAAERSFQTLQQLKVPWVRFGDEVLLLDSERGFAQTSRQAKDLGLAVDRTAQTAQKRRLHLVVQKGRVFQLTHPDVPVLLDKGRYLVVDLAPSRARQLNQRGGQCFLIEALEDNQTVFEVKAVPGRRISPPPVMQTLSGRDQSERSRAQSDAIGLIPDTILHQPTLQSRCRMGAGSTDSDGTPNAIGECFSREWKKPQCCR